MKGGPSMSNRKFFPSATAFRKANMAYLAFCAQLAYKQKDDIGKALQKLGFDPVNGWSFIESKKTHTQGFIAGDKKKIIIAFRGTEGGKIKDWGTDVKVRRIDWPGAKQKGQVHRGFHGALDSVWKDVTARLKALKTGNQTIWITGHSLGAALATLAAASFALKQPKHEITGVYTFGQPRVMDFKLAGNFNQAMKKRFFRVVNNNDVVTRVPPQVSGYSHVGLLYYFDSNGKLHTDGSLSWWGRFWDRVAGRFKDVFDLDTDGIGDHKMENYRKWAEKA